jgi:GNAT superfamily N-acetyltransferase
MQGDSHSISIDRVHAHEIDVLLNLYVDLFHNREPFTKCVGFSRERMISIARTMYAGSYSNVRSQGLCWIARDHAEARRGVGFIVCDDPAAAGAQRLPENLDSQEAEIVSAVVALLDEIRSPIKQTLGVGNGVNLHIAAVGVAPGYEGKGIARRLLQSALSAAYNLGFQFAFSECTSVASRMLHEKCGFEHLNSATVSAFVLNGRRPFAGCDCHIHLMRKILNNGRHR